MLSTTCHMHHASGLLRAAKVHTTVLGHEEGMGFYDAVDFIEEKLVQDPENDRMPMTEITDRAAEICRTHYEDTHQ